MLDFRVLSNATIDFLQMKYGAFFNRKTLSNGAARRPSTVVSPSSSLLKSVCLHDLWLIKPQEGEEGLAVAGFSSRDGFSVRAFKSAAISKRHDATTLETVDGFTIKLVGFINKDLTQQNGFSSEVCRLFRFGLSYDWEECTTKGSNKVLHSNTIGLAKHTLEDCSINNVKILSRKIQIPECIFIHQESDCDTPVRKAMDDLFACVNMSGGVMLPPDRTQLLDGHGFAKKFPIETKALEKCFQFEDCEETSGSTQPGHVDRRHESGHAIVPTKRKFGYINARMTESVESPTTSGAGGGTSRTNSDKTPGSRRISRSMPKEKKDVNIGCD